MHVVPCFTYGISFLCVRSQTISDRFLKLDLDKDDVQSFLREFVLTLSDGMT